MESYRNTFITASEDGPDESSVPPAKPSKTIAEVQYEMLVEHPYEFTQDDVLFASSRPMREEPDRPAAEREQLRTEFFSRSQACLRASVLVKRYGWGIHFDEDGKAAAFPTGSNEYKAHASDSKLQHYKGMRTKRAP